MKNFKSLVLILFMTSCSTSINSNTAVIPTSNPNPSSSPNISPSIKSTSLTYKSSKEIKIFDGDNEVVTQNVNIHSNTEVSYNIVSGESKKLSAIAFYNDGSTQKDLIWNSSDTSIVMVDNSGLIKSGSILGTAYISVFEKDNPNFKLKIYINHLKNLNIIVTRLLDCNPTEVTIERQRFEYKFDSSVAVGTTGDPNLGCRTSFLGKVYDTDNNEINGAIVESKVIEPVNYWKSEKQITVRGAYVIRNAPSKVKIEITASKEGFISKSRIEVLKINLEGNPAINVFDFNGVYALKKIN